MASGLAFPVSFNFNKANYQTNVGVKRPKHDLYPSFYLAIFLSRLLMPAVSSCVAFSP